MTLKRKRKIRSETEDHLNRDISVMYRIWA